MKVATLFRKELRQAIKDGKDHSSINWLAGCTERKIVLSEAEVEAGKKVYAKFMSEKLWHDDEFGESWMFGSPETMLNIGMVPLKLAKDRRGLNRQNWDKYNQVY